jgi:DNA-binding NtrC family response regulator
MPETKSVRILVVDAGRVGEAERLARLHSPDIVISDVVLPEASGLDLLRRLKAGDADRPVVLMTAHGRIDDAVEAMKLGARDFLTKPLDYAKLRAILQAAEREVLERRLAHELESTLDHGAGLGPLVGDSPRMREVYRLIKTVGESDASVIVTGESGTGKELVARAIHDMSRRRSGPFIAVNVAAIPEGLMESELLGHERGAFTGAVAARSGCFELADGGTLFLDEVTEMPAAMQPKLLRVLEESRLRRVGGSQEIRFNVRVIAATNRVPEDAVANGILRHDLFYRLNVFTIALPALRERGGDVALLGQHFIRTLNEKHETSVKGLDAEARALLGGYGWPGNVRELRNVIERAVILARSGLIAAGHLPPYLKAGGAEEPDGIVIPPNATAAEAERMLFLATLERVGHNKAEAARRLGVDVKTIRNKLHAWGLGSDER